MSFFNLELGVPAPHKNLLNIALNAFPFKDKIKKVSSFLYGPSEPKIVPDTTYFYNVGLMIQSSLTWGDLKEQLTIYASDSEFMTVLDIDILIQHNLNKETLIVNPKAILYTHSMIVLNELTPDLKINNRSICSYIDESSNIYNEFKRDAYSV